MTDKELIKTVTSFRSGILGRISPLKMCYAICGPLSTFLEIVGCKNELTEGTIILNGHNKGITINHFWITFPDKRIIDPTSSQFNGFGNEDLPTVYFGEKPKWYIKKRNKKLKLKIKV
jgi:hypothetical protein